MPNDRIRVAIVGVGNCASSLIQGVHFYRDADDAQFVPGLMHANLGGYRVRDIEFSAAFDIHAHKVGVDLAQAISTAPNNTIQFAHVPKLGVRVQRGPTLDGRGKYLEAAIPESTEKPVDVAAILRRTGTDVVISYLPVGSQHAAEWYAQQALEANCALINCMPVFIASTPRWQQKFAQRSLPIIGDDIKSQLGATITHRVLAQLFDQRGVRVDRTYQLNVGGNTDFLNMLERERLESKKISKRNAVTSQLSRKPAEDRVHIGPSDHVPWLEDRKVCFIRIEGTTFGNVPLNCELRLEVWDSPNSAGVVIDAVRCAKLALDHRIGGPLIEPSGCFMKSPPQQFSDEVAHEKLEAFIARYAQPSARPDSITTKSASPAPATLRASPSAPATATGTAP